MKIFKTIIAFLLPSLLFAQTERLQGLVDSLRIAGNYPGLSVAMIYKDGTTRAIVSGFNDKEKQIKLKTSDALMQGSVGKTYASAIALQLVNQGKLDLDKKVSAYLGDYSWYSRIPNASTITVRMLMNHTSGVMRYEFKE